MIIVGENLQQLMKQHKIVDRLNRYDETCIQLSLGSKCIRLQPNPNCTMLTYGEALPNNCVQEFDLNDEGLLLEPKTAVLASSAETICMPEGYMGLLQTKGSLARLCVSIHFSDGQIDPGFQGKVTFEIFNASDFIIRIRKLQAVGNLYLLKTSTPRHKMYDGKYAHADGPTIQMPFV